MAAMAASLMIWVTVSPPDSGGPQLRAMGAWQLHVAASREGKVFVVERGAELREGDQLGFFYTGYSPGDTEAKLRGFGITPEFRFYLSDTPAPVGTYLAPNFRYMSQKAEDPTINEIATLTSYGLAINLGKQWMLKDIILIDIWVGPAYNFRTLDDPSGEVDVEGADGFGIRLGLALGIAF